VALKWKRVHRRRRKARNPQGVQRIFKGRGRNAGRFHVKKGGKKTRGERRTAPEEMKVTVRKKGKEFPSGAKRNTGRPREKKEKKTSFQ